MRYWEHPDWPAVAASVRDGGRTESLIAADWVEEVGGDGPVAGRVRLLAESPESLRAVEAIGRQVKGWAAEWLPEGERPAAGWDYLSPGPYRVGELNLEFRHGFVRRICCTGRHLHVLHQLCLREPVAEVVVCGPLWGRAVNGTREDHLPDPKNRLMAVVFRCGYDIPGWPGGGLRIARQVAVTDLERQLDWAGVAGRVEHARRLFMDYESRPEGLLSKFLVPPGPRVEWCRQADAAEWVNPPPPGARLFLPANLRAAIDWERIARWHADHPDGWVDGVPDDYPDTAQRRAAPGYGPYTLYGRNVLHTIVRG